jgi:hypothetical protein
MDTAVNDFVDKARQYCNLIQHRQAHVSSWVFAHQCLQSVLSLYRAGLALPEIEVEKSDAGPDPIEHADWEVIGKSVAERLSRDLYWKIFEPLEKEPPEPVAGSITDDLADIWRDVQMGLELFGTATRKNKSAAVWHWRFSMDTHWGRHAVWAACALTALCFGAYADETRPS